MLCKVYQRGGNNGATEYLFPLIVGILLLLSACTGLEVTPESISEEGPRLSITEPVYDFGYAGPGMQVRHTFSIINSGTQPLVISGVNSDCGCTVTLLPGKKILPGKSGSVQVSFETRKYEGKQKKNVILNTNDIEEKEIVLILKGRIKRDTVLVPQGINLGDVVSGKTATGKVRLLQLSNTRLTVLKIDAPSFLRTRAFYFRDENSRGYEIEINLSGDVPVGPFTEVITLHTNLRKRSRIDVPVWANIVKP